jgi:hypothetical protein
MSFLDTILGMLGNDSGGAPPSPPPSFDDRFPQAAAPVMPQPDPMQSADAGMPQPPPGGIPIPRPRPPEAGPAANELDTVPPPQPRNVSLLPDSNAPPQSQGGLMQAVMGAPPQQAPTDDPSAMLRELMRSRQRGPVSTFLTSLGGGLANLKNSPFKGQVAANSFGGATQAGNEADKEDFDQRAKALSLALQIKAANGKPSFAKIGQGTFGEEQYGFVDPNTKSVTPYSAPNGTPTPTALGPDGLPPKQANGEDFLKTRPVAAQNLIKKIADYEVDPRTLSTKGGHRERILADVAQYRPEFDMTQFPSRAAAVKAFGAGPKGDLMRSFDVGISHLGTLEDLSKALNNGDVKVINDIRNRFKEQFGYTAPGNFDAAKGIVGDEIAKAIVGSRGALADRDEMKAQLQNAKTPDQLAGVIKTFKTLMAGQLHGLRKQYEDTTGLKNFDTRLSPDTLKELQPLIAPAAPASSPAPANAKPSTPTPRTKADFDAIPSGQPFTAPDGSIRIKP